MHRPSRRNLETHKVDLDRTPPGSPVGLPLMASSPRVRHDLLPYLVPDVGVWNSSTPSLLSFDLGDPGDKSDLSATFQLDSLVTSLCTKRIVVNRWRIRPPPSIDASPVPTPPSSPIKVATDDRAWLDNECNLRSVDRSEDLLEVESMVPVAQTRQQYIGSPSYQPCRMDIQRLRDNQENRFVRNVYRKGTYCFIQSSGSKGRPLFLHEDDRKQVALHVSALLTAGLIQKWRRTSFISYPFVVPKALGESRLIVDFSHLQGKYTKPSLHMPAFPAVLRRLYPLEQGDFMVRVDLRAAFYNVPLPERLRDVTAFRFDGNTFVFKVLPMGLFISPAILQSVVQEAVRKVIPGPQRRDGMFAWIHLNDIFIVANERQKL